MSTSMATSFAAERGQILQEFFRARRGLLEVRAVAERTEGRALDRLGEHARLYAERAGAARQRYLEGLPFLTLSRCPFTDQVVRHSIDPHGLDGLWWRYDRPARPPEDLPETYYALAGALRLGGPPEPAPFICRPGPELPYVVPRLLNQAGIVAVLSSVLVGPHTAYAIFYFAQPMPSGLLRVNTWGTRDYRYQDEHGEVVVGVAPEDPDEYDFDLGRWISSGRLRWIAPGDPSLALRDTLDGCPYLSLSGRREILTIQEGTIW